MAVNGDSSPRNAIKNKFNVKIPRDSMEIDLLVGWEIEFDVNNCWPVANAIHVMDVSILCKICSGTAEDLA